MKLRIGLLLFCLLGIGIFGRTQNTKKNEDKPKVENGADAIPVTVSSHKKAHRPPPPPLPLMNKKNIPVTAPKPAPVKLPAPKMLKDGKPLTPPPPPPAKKLQNKADKAALQSVAAPKDQRA